MPRTLTGFVFAMILGNQAYDCGEADSPREQRIEERAERREERVERRRGDEPAVRVDVDVAN